MARRSKQLRTEVLDLVNGRPGWRLEPRTTPGASPLWCFVVDGEIDLSVSVEDGAIQLYIMATDQDVVLPDSDALTAWMLEHRPQAMQEAQRKPRGKIRAKSMVQWE